MMMRNKKNTIAKLLAEEDIFVVYKQMETAYFDVKNRELGLPIWKENTMSEAEEELLICHEIGHALETPLDMLESASLRKLEHSVVNVLEDARIEKKVKGRYLGTVRIFNAGYASLAAKDFFGTAGKDLSKYNLIDRINLHFKTAADVSFSENEMVWVDRTAKTETPDEVLDLAEELVAWMSENPESMGEPDDEGESDESMMDGMPSMDMPGEPGETDESMESEGSGDTGETGEPSEEKSEGEKEGSKSDDGDTNGTGKGKEPDEGESLGDTSHVDDVIEGGDDKSSGGASIPNITAETAEKFGKSLDSARDKSATSFDYVRIPDVDLNKIILPYKTVISEMDEYYIPKSKDRYYTSIKSELDNLKKSSKKTVSYMVKEFEMKKSADQYARAATSKTGSLDMGKLYTYKYNEDLFKKVTTLPGATNHGLVMCLDWSGSMASNLKATVAQLFNLIWFCRRTQIPFEVFAFSDAYKRSFVQDEHGPQSPEVGTFILGRCKMMNFFSSKMTIEEEMKIMHYLYMIASNWGEYRDWQVLGYPIGPPPNYSLGGTPLNEAIIAMMKIVPKFKNETGVQKVNTVFLTDGAARRLESKFEYKLDTNKESKTYGEHLPYKTPLKGAVVISDPVTNYTLTIEGRYWNCTPELLKMLKKRVPEMNIVGFFVAGHGRAGKVGDNTLRNCISADGWATTDEIKVARNTLKKDNVLTVTSVGYDEYYILPGAASLMVENESLGDDLIGASKAKLKTAFAKNTTGRLTSRPLLNKFVAMVA